MLRADVSKARAGLLLLSAILLTLTLAARKPGTPATLKADEPAYYLGALSLAYDFDFRAEERDFVRAFEDYPYAPVENLIVMSPDGWRTLYYGKPYIYSFFAAPFVYLFGTNGIVFFNMAMLLAMVWMGFALLARANGETVAALFAAGFFLLSNAYLYVWWLHPEVFNMVAAMGCLFFGLPRDPKEEAEAAPETGEGGGRFAGRFAAARWLGTPAGLAVSAAMLTAGAYNKPILAACCLPVIFALLRRREWKKLAIYAAAGIGFGLLWVGLSVALTGKPSAYLVGERAGFFLVDPHRRLIEPEPIVPGAKKEERESAGWFWLLDAWPDTQPSELAESTKYFLIGRHTGLFVYQPFALLALGLFAFSAARRSLLRWSILVAAALVAFFFLEFINFNWHGGGGFVGNRYFVMAYPLLIFLVGRIRFDLLVLPFYLLAGFVLGPLLVSPHGLVVFSPTLQSHVRGPAFQLFPFEHSLREIPGYEGKIEGEVYVTGLRDQVRAVGDGFWLQGGRRVEVWVQSVQPLREISLYLASPVEGNPARASLEGESVDLVLGAARQRVVFHPAAPSLERRTRYPPNSGTFIDVYLYRLEIRAERGRPPMPEMPEEPYFYLGATLDLPGAEQQF